MSFYSLIPLRWSAILRAFLSALQVAQSALGRIYAVFSSVTPGYTWYIYPVTSVRPPKRDGLNEQQQNDILPHVLNMNRLLTEEV